MTKNIYQCDQCNKSFTSSQSLNAHKNKHSNIVKLHKKKQCPTCENNISVQYYQYHIERRKFCLNCNNLFCLSSNNYKNKFCSRSCSASYNNKIQPMRYRNLNEKEIKRYWYCKNCGKEHNKTRNTRYKKYCDSQCQSEYRWTKKAIQIKNGEGTEPRTIKRYLKEKHGDQCFKCNLPNEWNGEPLVLQLDHIDGNSDNNHLDNLRLLCPNCHSQTETFGNAGKGNRYKKNTKRNRYLQEWRK